MLLPTIVSVALLSQYLYERTIIAVDEPYLVTDKQEYVSCTYYPYYYYQNVQIKTITPITFVLNRRVRLNLGRPIEDASYGHVIEILGPIHPQDFDFLLIQSEFLQDWVSSSGSPLLNALNSAQYQERESAHETLLNGQTDSFFILCQGLKSKYPEVRIRCKQIISQIRRGKDG